MTQPASAARWWLLECSHYATEDDAFDTFGTKTNDLMCRVCPRARHGGLLKRRMVKRVR